MSWIMSCPIDCTKIKFTQSVLIFNEIQWIVLHMEYAAMKTDIQTQPKHYAFTLYTWCKRHIKYLLNQLKIKKCLSKWHFVQSIDSFLFTRTSKPWTSPNNSTLPSNIYVSVKSTPLLLRMLHHVEIWHSSFP
jgi:hypothetical protein